MREEHWWDNLLWVLIFLFLIPSSLVVASWNSLPGSRLYRVKLAAEDSLVALSFSKASKSELEVSFTDKRLSDATEMLSQSESGEGLEYFRKQMEDAKNALAQAPDGSAKEELKAKYLAALQNASHQLDQQKQLISTAHNIPSRPKTSGTVSRPSNGTPATREVIVVKEVIKYNEVTKVNEVTRVNEVTHVNEVTNVTNITNVINQIDDTQTQISNIINEVQSAPAASADIPTVVTNVPLPTFTPVPTIAPTPLPTNTPVVDLPGNSENSNGNKGSGDNNWNGN